MSKQVTNFEALDATQPYDVCIIGAGIAGAVLALKCVRAGLNVLLADSGALRPGGRFDARPSPRDAYEAAGDTRYTPWTPPRLVGGGSNLWKGYCERFEPGDFDTGPYTRDSNPWPVAYVDLARHYRAAEQVFRVREAAPRRGRLPPLQTRQVDRAFEVWMRRHGVDARGIATATPARGATTFSTARELLPELTAARNGTLVSGVTVTRLRTDRNGRVVGAMCRTHDGASKTARAETYVVAAGALESARLLLLSRSQRFQNGIGNDFDRVGRGFNDHAILTASSTLADTPVPSWGPKPRPLHTEQFHRTFRREGLGAVHPIFSPGLPEPPPVGGRTRRAGSSWTRGGATLGIACRIEIKPSDANRLELARRTTDGFGDPAGRLIFNYSAEDHALIERCRAWLSRWLDRFGAVGRIDEQTGWDGSMLGTCRMGTDPRTSVCDATLKVHSSPNLYVCGSSVFPTGNAVPPALTVAALADRLGDHVIARTRWCARTAARPRPKKGPKTPATTATIESVRRRPQP